MINARAMASCWRWPPESSPAPTRQQLTQSREEVEHLGDQLPAVSPGVRYQFKVLLGGQLWEALLSLRHVAQAALDTLVGPHPGDVLAIEQDPPEGGAQ